MDYITKDFRELQRYTKTVPFELSHVVCTCTTEEQQKAHKPGLKHNKPIPHMEWLTFCNACGKYPRYLLRRCANCKTPYVSAFDHPNRCIKLPLCWTCTNEYDGQPCEHFECVKHHRMVEPPQEVLQPRQKVRAEDIVLEDFVFDLD